MDSKPAMTCYKYKMYLYGSEAMTYLNAVLWMVTEPELRVIKLPPLPTTGSPTTLCMAPKPSPNLEENSSMIQLTLPI